MLKKNLRWTEDDFVIENNIIKEVKEEARDGKVNYPPLKTISLWSGGLKSPKID